jgi:tetratricopeptide (TPR) repeat protein
MGLAEQAQPELKGPDQAMWLERLDVEFGNIRVALEWASDSDPEVAVRMMFALMRFWHIRGHYAEGSSWIERVLGRGAGVPPIVRAKALRVAGQLAHFQNNVQRALLYLEESLIWARQAGDKALISEVQAQLGYGLLEQGNHARAKTLFEESLVLDRELGDTYGICWLTTALGELARLDEDYAQAHAYYEEGLLLAREAGNAYNICMLVANLGSVALAEGDFGRAVPLFQEGMTLVQELGYEAGMVGCLAGFVGIAVAQGQLHRSAKLSGAMEHLFQTINAGLDFADQRAYERYVASTRAHLGEEAWEAARAEGRSMSMEEAIAYASKWEQVQGSG